MDKDPKRLTVSVRLGVTVNMGDLGFLKPEVSINDIDPNEDVDAQIARGMEIAVTGFRVLDAKMEDIIADLISVEGSQGGYKERVESLEKYRDASRENFKKIVEKIKALEPKSSDVLVSGETSAPVESEPKPKTRRKSTNGGES